MISLLFNMLSRFVIAFLPRSNHLLISWLQSLSTVTLEPKKIKSATLSIFSPSMSAYESLQEDFTWPEGDMPSPVQITEVRRTG